MTAERSIEAMTESKPVAWWFAPPHGDAPIETPIYPLSVPCETRGDFRFRVVPLPTTTACVGIEVIA